MIRLAFAAGTLLAGLAASPASAAEQGTRLAPSATDGLRPCPGGFVLPGSAACLRMSGSVTTEMTLRSGTSAGSATGARSRLFSSGVQGRVAADVRVPTEAGPLRVYVAIRGRAPRLTDGRP